jgi:hypothetical protein
MNSIGLCCLMHRLGASQRDFGSYLKLLKSTEIL